MKRPRPVLVTALALIAAIAAWGAWAPPAVSASVPSAQEAAELDVTECGTCHEKAVTGMKGTAHLGLAKSCASCHDGTAEHLEAQKQGTGGAAPSVKKLDAQELSATCLTCHDRGHQANFEGGVHDRRGVSCASCHSVHSFQSVKGQIKTARDAETCYTCHAPIRSKGMRASHHPVREGVMTCGSCHDPHDGTRPKMVSADFTNEKCLECHTEKRGPFLWEHAPVRENCLQCHDPHGSNHEKLLVSKQPYLCQRCHLNTRHPGTLYDARNTLLGASASNRAIEHSCRNCHQQVHGTNAPSGPYLGR
jgi:DmsE family decaheme c-type cytochrome